MENLCLICGEELIAGDDVVDLAPGTLVEEHDPDCGDISWMARKVGIDPYYVHEACLKKGSACQSMGRLE